MKHYHQQQNTSNFFGMETRMNRLIFTLNNNYVAQPFTDGYEFYFFRVIKI